MLRMFLVLLIVAVPSLLVEMSAAQSVEKDRIVIRIDGSNSLIQSAQNWGTVFTEKNPNVSIIGKGGGTAEGFKKLLQKHTDIVYASEKLSDKEKRDLENQGLKLVERFLVWGGVCVATNPGNPVNSLSMDQLKKMFTGEIKSWKEVGGADVPVTVIVRDEEKSGTTRVFRDVYLEGKDLTKGVREVPNFRSLIRYTRSIEGSLGLVGCLALASMNHDLKILDLKKNPEASAVKWAGSTFKDQSYPISRPLYFYWDATSPNAAVYEEFSKFYGPRIWEGHE
jgi:phosphate transport system substrate-binding protein